MSIQIGQIITVDFSDNEKFAIGKIMQGGMGTVYQLVPIRANAHPLALKTLKSVMKIHDFERECEMWLSITQHPNVARAFAFGKWEGLPAILVDWYPKSMAELNATECSNDYLIELISGLISALDFAYRSAGMIHQDIKPANILIAKDGVARLSDFGLASCARIIGGKPIHQWQDIGNLTSGTSGPVSGTPFFMAPELFAGDKPSIKTDIFSIGVTLYHFLTGEHPYFGPETKGRSMLQLRKEPLARIISSRGSGITPILNILSRCLAIEPKDRPDSYQAGDWFGRNPQQHAPTSSNSLSEISAAVGQAQFYRIRKDFTTAENVLKRALSIYPEDPILLNALGVLHIQCGRKEKGLAVFSLAFHALGRTAGIHHGALYLDPVINFAGQLFELKNHSHAQVILKKAWGWIKKGRGVLPPPGSGVPSPDGWYCEFGWMFLYEGDFDSAVDYLENALSKKGIDKTSTYWLLEAAWLANRMKIQADLLARKLLQPATTDSVAALCGCLVAQFANHKLAREMVESISPEARKDIAKAERDADLSQNALLYPKTIEAQKLIVLSLDDLVTGGKHIGHIRQISKPRMA